LIARVLVAMVINARFAKPLDTDMILTVTSSITRLITIEENVLGGGFGGAVIEFLNDSEISNIKVKRLGIHDRFVEQGSRDGLLAKYGLDEEGIFRAALALVRESTYTNPLLS